MKKQQRFLQVLALVLLGGLGAHAQRTTDVLDRGLVAIPANGGNFVSWRIYAEEYYDTDYYLYRDGERVTRDPLHVSCFQDAQGTSASRYQVAAVVRGVEQEKSEEVVRWSQQYKEFAVEKVVSRRGYDVTSHYTINDISLADVTGDGRSEFIVKRLCDLNYELKNDSAFNLIECYTLDGERLWWIDCGPNLLSGSNVELNAVAYDWDQDGRAEVLMRGADNMVLHLADGTTRDVGDMTADTRWSGMEYTNSGREFLLYLDGLTATPYYIGDYPLPRYDQGETSDLLGSSAEGDIWGAGIAGHRPTKHFFGAPFLDGRHPSMFLARGIYTRTKMVALDVNPATHELTERWRWKEYSSSSPWFGQGYHNFAIADVDWDGRDEIVYGSMVIDDNGQGLSTTGLGHGDAQHCGDLDPYRHGQEQFACNETSPAMNYRDATTSRIYYRLQSTGDDGRALCGNFTNDIPGCIGRSTQSGMVSTVADKIVSEKADMIAWSDLNFRIYWDGDLLEEIVNSPGTERECVVIKPGQGRILQTSGCNMCNWTKNTPCAQGDILGDWREELVLRADNNTKIRIYTTPYATEYRNYTLWHDHQYRQAMVWQMCGYNQPPHVSYFLGELEGITVAPPPLTMTGRTEIAGGGSITSANDDQHVLVCETGNTAITVADGARPYIATFNVPSWVQGTNSTSTTNPAIVYDYYTCTVSGGAFAGGMRLVKQGDGTLVLPAVEQQYTGPTDVWAGTLSFDGQLPKSPLWLNRFAQLHSDGGLFRSIRMDYASVLRPGDAGLTADTLRLGFGARVVFTIGAAPVKSKLMTIETKNWKYGPQYLTPVFEFVMDGDMPAGDYLLAEVGRVDGSLKDIRLEGVPSKLSASLRLDDDGQLWLVMADTREPGAVVWNGTESNVWDFGQTDNFTLLSDGSATSFVTGDNVYFTDEAQLFSVSLTGDIEADSIIVDNTTAYTFTGTGSITGSSTLVKRGSGMLTVQNDNSYKGGTRISGGVLRVSSLSNANQALGNLGSVNNASTKFVIENGAELRTTAAVTQGSPMRMEGDDGGIIQNSADFVVDKPINGTRLMKKGSGWMKLNTSNTSLKRLVIAGGTVQCISATTPAQTVEFQSGTLSENTGTSYNIEVPEGGQGTWNLVNDATYTNKLTGAGTITISCPVRSGGSGSSKWYATRTRIAGDWSAFEGTVKPTSNGDPSGRFTLDNAYGMPLGTFSIAEGVEVQNSGRTYRIGQVTGSGSLGGSCTFSNGASVGANTWLVGTDADFSFAGAVTSNANFTKQGSGRMTVSGKWTTTGVVRISEGELRIGSSAQLGTGSLTVADGAALSGTTGTGVSLANSSVQVGGRLQVGLSDYSSTGVMDFGGKNVTFTATSVLRLGVRRAATATSTGGASLRNVGRLVMDGTVDVFLSTDWQLAVGDSVVLWQAATAEGTPRLSSYVISEADGLYWDATDLARGILRVTDADPTGISPVMAGEQRNAPIYTPDGRMVGHNRQSLQPGLYIQSGRKFVVPYQQK